MADCTVMPLLGMNCNDTGAEKLTPVRVIATVVPCVPCNGENSRRAGRPGCVVAQPLAAIPGGQFCDAVMVKGIAARRLWSASIRMT